MTPFIQRGDVFWANLDPTIGVEIQKTRPVVVMSNDVINQRSQLVIVAPLTTNVVTVQSMPKHRGILSGAHNAGLRSRYAVLRQV